MKRFLPKDAAGIEGRRWFGLDLAKKESQLAVLDAKGEQIAQKRFKTTRENILALASELEKKDTIALEVTTNSTSIARILRDNSEARLIVSNPIKTKLIAQAKVKTDKIDARVLAELARAGYLPEVWLPDEDTEMLRHLFTDRRSLVDRRTELKNTVHSVLHRNLIHARHSDVFGTGGRKWLEGVVSGEEEESIPDLDRLRLGSLLTEIDRQDALVNDQDSIIASFIATRPHLRKQLDILVSIPGVSLVVGAGLIAAIGDISRFPTGKKLAAYFGVVPSTKQSGESSRNGRITKQGRSEARWLLVEAAEHLRKANGPLHALYKRIHRQRGHNVAVIAVARKLSELVFHLLTKQEDFLYSVPRQTIDKRSNWRKLARRKVGVEVKSAARRAEGRQVLYGTGISGKRFKTKIVREAALRAERIYEAIIKQRQESETGIRSEDLIFDPTMPVTADWEKVLKKVAELLLEKRQVPKA